MATHRPGNRCAADPKQLAEAHGVGDVGLMKKGYLAPSRRETWTYSWKVVEHVTLARDGKGRPLSIEMTPGHRLDSTQLQAVLEGIRVPPPRPSHRRPGLKLPTLSPLVAVVTDPAPHSRATRPPCAMRRSARMAAPLRQCHIRPPQRGRAVLQSAQAVAWSGNAL
jgi:hypothetical protein